MSYWSRQFDRIAAEPDTANVKIKISNEQASTNWLNLTAEQYQRLERFLLDMEGEKNE